MDTAPPRLTIVIPTHDRPDMLPIAVRSALGQRSEDGTPAPVQVIVADDGDRARTAEILARISPADLESGRLRHLGTGATEPWENWRAGALAADTEFVAWHQDDDHVSPYYAGRILASFDFTASRGHHRSVWFGRLSCATRRDGGPGWGLWYAGNGPMVPMPDLYGCEQPFGCPEGALVAPSMYFTAWSLSPALAYRNGPEFRAALQRMPERCDIYVERIIPAEMAAHGGFIADPVIIGQWVQHDTNLSRAQHADQPRQTRLFHQHMDDLLDRIGPDLWAPQFAAWCRVVPPAQIVGWINGFDHAEREGGRSRHHDALLTIALESLRGRVKPGALPWRRRLALAARSALKRIRRPSVPESAALAPAKPACMSAPAR